MSIDILESGSQFDEEPAPLNSKAHGEIETILSNSTFGEVANRWRGRLFPVGSIIGGITPNVPIFLMAPSFYSLDTAFYIGGMTLLSAACGVGVTEGLVYYLADRKART